MAISARRNPASLSHHFPGYDGNLAGAQCQCIDEHLVGSFEQTLRTWLETRLHADLYIRPPSQRIDTIQTQLMHDPGVMVFISWWQIEAQLSLPASTDN